MRRWLIVVAAMAATLFVVAVVVSAYRVTTDDDPVATNDVPGLPYDPPNNSDARPAQTDRHPRVLNTAMRFVAAYQDPDRPDWRAAYTRYTTDALAERLATVPRRVVPRATPVTAEPVSVGIAYAVVTVGTNRPLTLRLELVYGPTGWDVTSVVPE